ncbi:MAG: hypothetical protein CL610_22440 [Anaerolineaceae bacterium]|nr:hypothetical protein [Anaerolineaceae bacterium]
MTTLWIILSVLLLPFQQAAQPGWCPVEQAAVLEAETYPLLRQSGDRITVTYADTGAILSSTVRLPDAQHPIVSDDAAWIASVDHTNEFDAEIAITRVATNETRHPVRRVDLAMMRSEAGVAGYGPLHMAWIPGTHRLAFSTRVYYRGDGIHEPIADDLWLLNADTGEITPVLQPGEGGHFTLSPDGRFAVVENQARLLLADLTNQSVREIVLANYRTIGAGHTLIYPPVHWLPDSSGFFIVNATSDEAIMMQSDGVVEVWQVWVGDEAPQLIGSHTAFFPTFSISPDLSKAAYWHTTAPQSNERTLLVADLAGAEVVEVMTANQLDFGRWLLDSQHFTLTLNRPNAGRVTLVADICGTIPLALPEALAP